MSKRGKKHAKTRVGRDMKRRRNRKLRKAENKRFYAMFDNLKVCGDEDEDDDGGLLRLFNLDLNL